MNCVVIFVDVKLKKKRFPRIRLSETYINADQGWAAKWVFVWGRGLSSPDGFCTGEETRPGRVSTGDGSFQSTAPSRTPTAETGM